MVPGTQGYSENAAALIEKYESLTFAFKHSVVLHLLPSVPVAALDIGAGTGADAYSLATQGHRVIAVEPTAAFRAFGAANHPSALIEWVNDSLPLLGSVASRTQQFGLIMLTAVWMHLAKPERVIAMSVLARLLARGGVIVMALRHGPVPEGRVMFAVSPEETIELAEHQGLRCVLNVQADSIQAENRLAGVTWSRLAFKWA